ncbi:fh protein interacting protein fip2 [Nicotiana attenuata]|uniref:Fh protein interacting protein fip2 n=1 Tax=Nicotiana attenuata TaxID=49451 RepID=A0A314LGA3_NICAT|nr:fh protein interacting protein fip2 [Nicotiana attenuata]
MADHSDSSSSSMVRLNIGGKKFCTTLDTLTQREPDSMLAAMFSGRHTICQESEKVYTCYACTHSFNLWRHVTIDPQMFKNS